MLSNVFGQRGAAGTPGAFSRFLQGGLIGCQGLAQIGAQRAVMQPFLQQNAQNFQQPGFNISDFLSGSSVGGGGSQFNPGLLPTGQGQLDLTGFDPTSFLRKRRFS